MNLRIYIFLLLTIVWGCDNGNRIEQTRALKNEIKASKIKRVTNTQLIYSANEWGKKIVQIAEKSLQNQLSKSTDNVPCKQLDNMPVVAALKKEYGIEIDLLTASDSSSRVLHKKEKELLSAYLYSATNQAATGDNLQQLNDTLFVYNAPVASGSPILPKCSAPGGGSFAVWRVLFSKKEIIRKLDARQLKK